MSLTETAPGHALSHPYCGAWARAGLSEGRLRLACWFLRPRHVAVILDNVLSVWATRGDRGREKTVEYLQHPVNCPLPAHSQPCFPVVPVFSIHHIARNAGALDLPRAPCCPPPLPCTLDSHVPSPTALPAHLKSGPGPSAPATPPVCPALVFSCALSSVSCKQTSETRQVRFPPSAERRVAQ